MSRRSAISGPGGGGGLSLALRALMRAASSITLPPRLSMSSARATPDAIVAQIAPHKSNRRMLLLRRRRRLRQRVLVGDQRLAEIHRRPVFRIGGDRIALLEANHLHGQLL